MSSYIYWSPEQQEWAVTFDKAVADAHAPQKDYKQIYIVAIGLMCVLVLLLYISQRYKPKPVSPDYRF